MTRQIKINQVTYERMTEALKIDPNIVGTPEDVTAGKNSGYPLEYFEELGMTLGDLLRLERAGLAFRFRTKNIYLPGETMPNGKEVPRAGNEYMMEVVDRVKVFNEYGSTRTQKVKMSKIFHKFSMRGKGSRVLWLLVVNAA